MRYILGADPGKLGGLSIRASSKLNAWKMPEDAHGIWELFTHICGIYGPPKAAFIENVHAMPKNGSVANFKMGHNRSALELCCIAKGIDYFLVAPRVWQDHHDCRTGGNKNVSKAKAIELFTEEYGKRITHAIADAMLIAQYGWDIQQ